MKAIRGPTMQQAGFHHANCLATQLRNDLLLQNTEILAMLQAMIIDAPVTEEDTNPPIYTIRQFDDSGQHSSKNTTLSSRYPTRHEVT